MQVKDKGFLRLLTLQELGLPSLLVTENDKQYISKKRTVDLSVSHFQTNLFLYCRGFLEFGVEAWSEVIRTCWR